MIRDGWDSQILYVNDQRIHVVTAGETGPLVLLCHGIPESWYSWNSQLEALSAAGYRAVAMDMRGYGRSSKPPEFEDYRITELVADCEAVVEALGESTAVIVGHDWGASVAWTAAWTKPEVFTAVVGVSGAFGGRGLLGLPGDPFGDIKPTVAHREIAGPNLLFYQEFFRRPGAEREIEGNLRDWLTRGFYSFSSRPPLPPELDGVDLTKLPPDALMGFLRMAMCGSPDGGFTDMMLPGDLPDFVSAEDFEYFLKEFEYSGMTGPMNYYKVVDLSWEELEPYQGTPVTVPSFFIGGDRDVQTIWSQEALARASEVCTDWCGQVVIPNCGHMHLQEQPEAVNAALLEFLTGL